jgi:hypothetical protein
MVMKNTHTPRFGLAQKRRDFYELAAETGAWVNLTGTSLTYTGAVVEYDSSRGILVLNPSINFIYSQDGRKRVALKEGELEIELNVANVICREVTSEKEAMARVALYNAELKKKDSDLFWDQSDKPRQPPN